MNTQSNIQQVNSDLEFVKFSANNDAAITRAICGNKMQGYRIYTFATQTGRVIAIKGNSKNKPFSKIPNLV